MSEHILADGVIHCLTYPVTACGRRVIVTDNEGGMVLDNEHEAIITLAKVTCAECIKAEAAII